MSAALHIDAVEIVPLDIMPKRTPRIATGVYTYSEKGGWAGRPVLVGVRAGGLVGWGEVRPVNPFVGETAASIFSNLRDFYAPLLLGRNPMEIDGLWHELNRKLPNNPAALATLDMALHDLVGKALGVPVHTLLGGACKTDIPLEWSVNLDDEKTMVAEAVEIFEKYRAPYISIKVGPLDRADVDCRVARAIQKELGPKVFLGADANTSYDTVTAIRFANQLADDGLAYFEQPVPSLGEMRWIRERINVPVMADESVYTITDALHTVAQGAADVIAMKFYKCGSLRRMRDIAVIAEAAGMRANCAGVARCNYIEAIAAAHVCASIPNHAFGAEFMMGLPSVWEDPIISNRPIDVKNGFCNVPSGPGLGFEIDAKAVKKYALERLVVDKKGARSLS